MVEDGRSLFSGVDSQLMFDGSEVCMISNRISHSSPSFSFSEEDHVVPSSLRGEEVSDLGGLGTVEVGRMEGSEKGSVTLGALSSSGAAVANNLVDRVSPEGQELVLFAGEVGGAVLYSNNLLEEELGKHWGWVQEIIDNGAGFGQDAVNPVAVREPDWLWNEGDKVSLDMSQEEVSKWVLRRIHGFGKFLGVSFDGFEDRTMKLFVDIEDQWRRGAESAEKRGGNKTPKLNKGVRELKSNYEGRKTLEGKGGSKVEGTNLLSFYEDQNH